MPEWRPSKIDFKICTLDFLWELSSRLEENVDIDSSVVIDEFVPVVPVE